MTTLDPIEEMIGKPLEKMAPMQLARYITYYHREANGIQLVDPPGNAEVSTLKGFQKHYGPERAADILRFLFLVKGGTYEVFGNTETIEHRHFTSGMRRWSNKIDIELQKKSQKSQPKKRTSERFVFAREL